MYDLAVKNGLVYTGPSFKEINIYIKDGIFDLLGPEDLPAHKTMDAAGKKIIPGIIDPHVHFALNIGRYTSADNFLTGSIAGIYGGVTTYIDFLDPVHTASAAAEAFAARSSLAQKSCSDYSFHVTAANPVGETEAITKEAVRLKLPSVKIFTAYSESDRRTYINEIIELLNYSKQAGTALLVHAEDEDHITVCPSFTAADLPANRPVQSETSMIHKLAEAVQAARGRMYIVHTTCGSSVESVSQKYSTILNKHLFLESCPHYFYLDESFFSRDDGCRYILAPPLRPKGEQEKLRNNYSALYSIGTDHCPFMSFEKNQEKLSDIPFGIGGIEHSFDLMYTMFGEPVIDRMTINPARLFNLYPKKGAIQHGSDADFFIYDETGPAIISQNHSSCDYSVYTGIKTRGTVTTTVIRGNTVLDNGTLYPHTGNFIPREAHESTD